MQQIARNAIALALVKNRNSVIALLRKYGVNVDKDSSSDQLIVAILVANRDSEKFRQELKELLLKTSAGSTQNFTAERDMQFFFTAENGSNFFNLDREEALARLGASQTDNTETSKEKTGLGKFLSGNLDKILGTGLTTLSTVITNKSNAKLADKAIALETEKTKQAQLAALAAGATSVPGSGKSMSTGAKIGIGIAAVALLGTLVYFIVRKKKG